MFKAMFNSHDPKLKDSESDSVSDNEDVSREKKGIRL
jgi:hypothetical protein